MWLSVMGFELRCTLRRPVFWLLCGAYFVFGLIYISSSVAGSALTSGAVHINAPWAVTRMVVHLSYLGLLGVAAFSGASIIRDFTSGAASTLFCTRLRKPGYVFGRFLGGYAAAMLSFSFVFVGLIVGNFAPWADPRLLGPFPAGGLLAAYLVFAVPNVLIASCVLFSLALLTRNMMKTYVGAVAILIGFLISRAFAGAFYATRDAQVIASLTEPFGAYASMLAVLDWTPHERNTIPIVAQALIAHNRVLWLVIGGLVLAVAYVRFPFQVVGPRRGAPRRVASDAAGGRGAEPVVRPAGAGRLSGLGQLLRLAWFETRRVLRGGPFVIVVGLSCVGLLFWVVMYGKAYGTGFYPYTGAMASHIRSVFQVPLIAVVIFYAADLARSAKVRRLDEIVDAAPASNAALFFSKLVALAAVVVVALLCGTATAIGYQLYRGFFTIDAWVYAVEVVAISLPYFLVMAAIALTMQAVTGNRLAGMLGMAGVFVFTLVAPELGVRSNLLIPGGRHPIRHTALAGFGHYLEPVLWHHAYWLLAAGLVSVLGLAAWPRGTERGAKPRLRGFAAGLTRGAVPPVAIALLLALGGVGGAIAYQTQVRNPTPSEAQREAVAAEYERRYGELRELPQPDIDRVIGRLRLFPDTRHFVFSATYHVVNRHDAPLRRVVLTARPDTRFTRIETSRPGGIERDDRHGVTQVTLDSPLAPGDTMAIDFEVTSPPIRGFRNRARRTPVAYDGSVLFHSDFLPELGYSRSRELDDERAREDHGLPPRVSSVRAADDPRGLTEQEGRRYARWVSLDMTVSTAADQRVVAQGELVARRVEGDRAHFRFVTRVPVKLHMGIVSGSYETVEQTHHGVAGPVRVVIHHMPGHGRNVDALMASLKRSLDTLEQTFGPYPYDRLKLVEVAMGKPTFRLRSDTILADTSLGFVNDPRLDDPRSPPSALVKLPASMVANLYIQSMVMTANQPGATSIPDGLGFFLSALVWGDDVSRFAIAETIRDAAWHYFVRRAELDEPEGTIVDHVNQTHVGAHKNAVAMYGLDLYLGRDRMISAIGQFLHSYRFKGPPFARMSDLVQAFRAEAPAAVQPIITDLFERRTVFDIAATATRVEPTIDGRYRVTVETRTRKTYVSPTGEPREAVFDYAVPLVVFGETLGPSGARRVLGRKMVTPEDLADGSVSIAVSGEPRMVGLDPYYRLLDRNYLDNRLPVK